VEVEVIMVVRMLVALLEVEVVELVVLEVGLISLKLEMVELV